MVLRYCLGMIRSVSTLIIFSGAATPSSTVNFSIAVSCGFRELRVARMRAGRKGVLSSETRTEKALRHVRLDRRNVLVGKPEMVADLVEQHVGDDPAQRLVVLGPVVENRPPVEPDQVGHLHRRTLGLERPPRPVK